MRIIRLHVLRILIVSLVLSSSTCCPTDFCVCSRWPTVVNCSGLTSIASIFADIPPNTETLIINSGDLYQIRDQDFKQFSAKDLINLEITGTALRDIHSEAFTPLSSLKSLKLHDNEIRSIDRAAFNELRQLEHLDLARNQLISLSSPDLFKSLINLLSVDLSDNPINNFPNGMFSEQVRLQELNIGGNNVVNLRGTSFSGVRNLRKFLASQCGVRTIENDFFKALSSIDTLDLSYNQISALPSTDAFAQLHNLRNLILKGNVIFSLVEGQFAGLNLDVLDLSRNSISIVNPNTFKYIEGLRNLDLSENSIQTIPSYFFQPIAPGLYGLKIFKNVQLETLPEEVFSGMDKLYELDISHLSLKSLSEAHFRNLESLKVINISHNSLQNLPQTFINRITINSLSVNLENNRWHCDCTIKPLRNWLQLSNTDNRLLCEHSDDDKCPLPQCISPANLANSQIILLSDNDLGDCENTGAMSSQNSGVLLGAVLGAVGGVVVIIVTVIIIMCLYRRHKRRDSSMYRDREVTEELQKKHPREKPILKRNSRKDKYFEEKKKERSIDPEIGSLNESDKDFVVRNYFRSMTPEPDSVSDVTQSMTRKGSVESLSQSGYGYGSRRGSRQSSQYSLNVGYKIESAV